MDLTEYFTLFTLFCLHVESETTRKKTVGYFDSWICINLTN